MISEKNIGLVLLAAGESRRLGQPKQLVTFQGKPLLQHVINCSYELDIHPKVLILGAYADEIKDRVDSKSFEVYVNASWQKGMASSLRLGVQRAMNSNKDLEAVMILVADQPFLKQELLECMVKLHKSDRDIVSCEYNGVVGVPAIFGKVYFSEIETLTGDQGAKKVMNRHMDTIKVVKFDQGEFDIDTPEDHQRLRELDR